MKTQLRLLAWGFGISLLCSCQKSDVSTPEIDQVYIAKIDKFKNEQDIIVQKMMYRTFSPQEKLQFWNDHFTIALSKSEFAGSQQKVRLINELKSMLSTKLLDETSSDARDVILSYSVPAWISKSKNVFSQQEITDLVYSNFQENTGKVLVTSPDRKRVNVYGDVESPTADCFCHVGNSGYSCKQLQVSIPSGVTIIYGMCEQTEVACNSSSRGCGVLWLESCNGGHCNY